MPSTVHSSKKDFDKRTVWWRNDYLLTDILTAEYGTFS